MHSAVLVAIILGGELQSNVEVELIVKMLGVHVCFSSVPDGECKGNVCLEREA